MKNKRLILVWILLFVIAFSAAACRNNQDEQENTLAVVESAEYTQPTSGVVADGVISEVVVEDEEEDDPSEMELSKIETVPGEETTNATTAPTENTTTSEEDQETTPTTAPDSDQEATTPAAPADKSEETVSDYDRYMAMSADEQQAFIESFPSLEAFMTWFNNAQAEHNTDEDDLTIDSGVIDLEELSKRAK